MLTASRTTSGLPALAALFLGLTLAQTPQAQSLTSAGVRAVATYEAAGLYWSAPGSNAAGCDVRYRKVGDATWSAGLPLWFDAALNECRGSIVDLAPGTAYEAELGTSGSYSRGVAFTTWSSLKPVARTVGVAGGKATLDITSGGTANGYVVYDGGGAVLDAANASPFNVTINASYVILRNFVLKGAMQDAIRVSPNVTDVVIEDNDISGWGRTRDGRWGTDMDSGIRAVCKTETLTRLTVQRNRIHDPRYPANSWTDGHPAGPQAVTVSYCGGNNVYRWNEIYSAQNHFNDGIGGEDNFSTTGFPNKDSDVYGNRIEMTWDDAIEAEGGNSNVRIWGNYLNNTATGIATTITSIGPVYVFRNVYNRSRFYEGVGPDSDDRQPMFKSGSSPDFGNGRRYLFHNTMLQATQSGLAYPLGGGAGIGGTGSTQLVRNTVSMNNIYHVWKTGSSVYQMGTDNTYQNDMFNGRFDAPIVGGINATPRYASGNGWQSEAGGMYQLAPGTAGFDGGVRIANFNDRYLGNAPDVGAAEAGAAAMKFGIAAASDASTPTTPTTPTTPPGTPGATPPSTTLASSSYTVAAGQGVTFTASVYGGAGMPKGSVNFTANGATIPGCSVTSMANGKAACTTASLPTGTHTIRGLYSGDPTYAASLAGPITQAVTGGASSTVDVAVTQTVDPNPAEAGKDLVFTLTATNNGPGAASGVTLVDTLPAGAALVWASPACSPSSATLTCSVGSLAAGASVQLRVVVRPGAAGPATNRASVSVAEVDSATGNNVSSAVVTVGTPPGAQQKLRYRLYSPVTLEHHFTTDVIEYNVLGAQPQTWVQEGAVGKVLDNPGSVDGVVAVPYYRLYCDATRWHHWTTDPNEYYTLLTMPCWQGEGVDGYLLPSDTAGSTALYRLLFPDGRGLHHWTTDAYEYNVLIAQYGWLGEGGSGFVIR